MLHTITKIKDIDERKFLDIYAEGNAENAEELYPEYEPAEALAKAEASFREFLLECQRAFINQLDPDARFSLRSFGPYGKTIGLSAEDTDPKKTFILDA